MNRHKPRKVLAVKTSRNQLLLMMMMIMMMMITRLTLLQNVFVARTITQDAFGGLISPRDFVDLVINEKTNDYLATNGEREEIRQ